MCTVSVDSQLHVPSANPFLIRPGNLKVRHNEEAINALGRWLSFVGTPFHEQQEIVHAISGLVFHHPSSCTDLSTHTKPTLGRCERVLRFMGRQVKER